jgi:hypothetical protein
MVDFFKKYWKLITGTFTGIAIFVLGIFAASKNTSKEKVAASDGLAQAKAAKKEAEENKALFEKWIENDTKLKKDKAVKVKEVQKEKAQREKELGNDPAKLDTILEDKFGLKKGE